MERDYDEVISEMLIQLAKIEQSREKENARMEAFDKRMELTIKRMVKAESRLERSEKWMDGSEKRMALFDQKLERSIMELEQYSKDQRELSAVQSQINKYFIDYINRSTQK